MSASTSRPFRRRPSRIIPIKAINGLGEPIILDVQTEEWLHARTGCYRRGWSARRVGRLDWDASSSAREALRRAAYVPEGKRPSWLAEAVKRAQTLR